MPTDLCLYEISFGVNSLFFLRAIRFLLLHIAGIKPFPLKVAATLSRVPTATVSVVMSGEMRGDIQFASSAITLSTLLSALTLCFWTYLVSFLGA
jgi:predicted permease